MPRAVERDKTEDPMKEVWSEEEYKRRVTDKIFNQNIVYTIKDAASHWKSKHKDGVSEAVYKKIVEEYFLELSRNIIQENYPYTWYKIGEFYVAKFNGSPAIHSNKSAEHHKLLSFVNLHTSGWIYMFYWAKKRSVMHNRDCYEFRPCEGVDEICGRKGIKKWIKKLHETNMLTDYNAFVRNDAMQWKRRKKREAENAKRKLDREEKLKNLLR